ncbi:class I SAM-dependent methyltransferase [Niallia oryzisoli]|uniref:Class I SAM-dependent methyltransferase n=1 Tax=Niallia oryzisoli TaxID=1737571 RepID=A0ABZ2CR92_9BACI
MNEQYYDKLLNIHTCEEQKRFYKSFHYHPYEPTPYSALETLFQQYELKNSDRIVDFGCGKGRLNFFIEHLFNATVIGIEMNSIFYQEALKNNEGYVRNRKNSLERIHFLNCLAEEYKISSNDNRFYFFNPFSIQIFRKVINNILLSFEQAQRNIDLILYYPSEDYIYFLEKDTAFELKQEVILADKYNQNPSERFLIYGLNIST